MLAECETSDPTCDVSQSAGDRRVVAARDIGVSTADESASLDCLVVSAASHSAKRAGSIRDTATNKSTPARGIVSSTSDGPWSPVTEFALATIPPPPTVPPTTPAETLLAG